MSRRILVIGSGRLAEQVSRKLSSLCQVTRMNEGLPADLAPEYDLGLVALDAWDPPVIRAAEQALGKAGFPWLPLYVSFGEGIVGPLVRSGVSGCSRCADYRLYMAGRDRREMAELRSKMAEEEPRPDPWASASALSQLSMLAAQEAEDFFSAPGQLRARVTILNLGTWKLSRHVLLPDAACPACGDLPPDTEERAVIRLAPNPKPGGKGYRYRSLDDLRKPLTEDYLDHRTGLFNLQVRDFTSPFADVTVNLPLYEGDELTAGRTHSYADSGATALLEGLERFCGVAPRGKRTTVRGSYRSLSAHALDPAAVGVHARERYEEPGFPFQRHDPDRPLEWVWGYSLLQEKPILVPERLAYYSLGCGEGYVYETSNGCALGGSLEEAIFYGMLEVVERDAFLLAWYARLRLPRIDPYSSNDPELTVMIEKMKAAAGYELHLFNATLEHGIPSLWAIARNTKEEGVRLICAAGAHPDPVRAAKGLLHELAAMMLTLDEKAESRREKILEMLADPEQVRTMEDHSMLYSHPDAENRLDFLLKNNGPALSFQEAFPEGSRHSDLTDDLKELLEAFRRCGMDVVVVNQTSPEIARNGLHCVKVLIPGMLPMTFGYHLTRLTGLDRVLRVPALLGYAEAPLKPEELNPHPHPFP
ncbi:TOMM precursor leader peptide-binding protein [Paenibacillus aurantius]|uniref:TOMM leader peptide-binding protein n=1 Tax=Paenibacillus aurantius TaxID=2918900 RepID=A0AA96LFY6_9BACL|nr:TOMM precursor leader peptide-binding protein [Paenibacillus aurantius]WNQ13344.1 TOMM precursor leader peptide-binding protein [Paenibacillus aurantius]